MSVERVSHGGWAQCLKLSNPLIEAVITTEVGPRVISLSAAGGKNLFKNYEEQLGGKGEGDWKIRGGHRLWVAPEDEKLTYALDNVPVPHETQGDFEIALRNPPAQPWGIAKELRLTLDPARPLFTVNHRITNRGQEPLQVAPWALSVMAPGGIGIIPQPPLGAHPRDLLPNRVMVLWPYTDLTDPRWTIGTEFITLKHSPTGRPTKLGLRHVEGWVAYALNGDLFIKEFPLDPHATHADFGCNFETFTNGDMLELESLGPMVHLAPGASVAYDEKWHVVAKAGEPPSDIHAMGEWIRPLLAKAGVENGTAEV